MALHRSKRAAGLSNPTLPRRAQETAVILSQPFAKCTSGSISGAANASCTTCAASSKSLMVKMPSGLSVVWCAVWEEINTTQGRARGIMVAECCDSDWDDFVNVGGACG
eukprot:9655755-Ditylum_brightwellii.AAC.1